MWYPPTVTESPASEPVSLEEAKAHLRVLHNDDDSYIGALITAARDHVERYCGAFWSEIAVAANCDDWSDLEFIPVVPVTGISSVGYIDTDGAPAAVDPGTYEFRADARSIMLKLGQAWPAKQSGSRIAVTMSVGTEDVPPAIKHAILLRVEDFYEHRSSEEDGKWSSFDSLLSNHRFY